MRYTVDHRPRMTDHGPRTTDRICATSDGILNSSQSYRNGNDICLTKKKKNYIGDVASISIGNGNGSGNVDGHWLATQIDGRMTIPEEAQPFVNEIRPKRVKRQQNAMRAAKTKGKKKKKKEQKR